MMITILEIDDNRMVIQCIMDGSIDDQCRHTGKVGGIEKMYKNT